jgi:hypothetical protein
MNEERTGKCLFMLKFILLFISVWNYLTYSQCRLNAWARWEVVQGPKSIGVSCHYMYVVHGMFLMLKHWFCWKYKYNKYMFNFIDHLHLNHSWLWLRRYEAPVNCFARGPMQPLIRPCIQPIQIIYLTRKQMSWFSKKYSIILFFVLEI